MLGISQEKLAEIAEISAGMVNDIEGCRTWVGDKTLIKLARALKTEVWNLFLPNPSLEQGENDLYSFEVVQELLSIKKNFDAQFENALKARGFGGR